MDRSTAMLTFIRGVYLALVAGLLFVLLFEPGLGARADDNPVALILFFVTVIAPAAYLFRRMEDSDIYADD